jgi:hypothetical protein
METSMSMVVGGITSRLGLEIGIYYQLEQRYDSPAEVRISKQYSFNGVALWTS